MKKEVFLAIAIGIALGLVITFGIWTANKSLASIKPQSTDTPPKTLGDDTSPTPTGQTTANPTPPQGSANLTIEVPEDETLTNQNKITVTGKTFTNATVIMTYEGNKQQVVLADNSGKFTTTVDLIAGYNIINIAAYDAAGAEANHMLTITYSTASI